MRGQSGMVCENCGAVGVFQFSCLPCNGYIDAPSGKVNSLRLQCASALRVETIGSSFKAPPQGEPHAPRSQGEANLHAVLHNAIEILRRRLKTVVPEFASSILALIKTKGSWLHSKRICDDDRIYFKQRLEQPSSARRAHRHRGFLRALDGDVKNLDKVTKCGLAYCFDRSSACDEQRAKEILLNYCMDPRAGKRNIHSHKGWVDITSTYKMCSTTGLHAARESIRLEHCLKLQASWSKFQGKSMRHQRESCAHFLSIIMRELKNEAEREFLCIDNAQDSSYQKHVKMVEIEKARFEAADRIMRLLAEYRAISSLEQFKYLHIS